MTNHEAKLATPRPWRVTKVLDEVDQMVRLVIAVPTEPTHCDKHIASICTWGGSVEPEADANASLIIQAVNAWDAHRVLVEEVRQALTVLRPQGDVKKDFRGHLALEALRKALAAVEAAGKV